MVAVIRSSSRLRNILNYSEEKVKTGVALCLAAVGYPKDVTELSFDQKLVRLRKLTELNQQTKMNGVHISLNFHPSEQLSPDTLIKISANYIDRIGFAGQPYLIYQHLDSAHPHLHIVTINVRPDGKRINLFNMDIYQSKDACKAIEQEFGLLKTDKVIKPSKSVTQKGARVAQYGITETKQAINEVTSLVVNQYKYGSLNELNALLSVYHINADRGHPQSRTFRYQGLVYRILDENGHKVGMPIKASSLDQRPTLKVITQKCLLNRQTRQPFKSRITNAIERTFLQQPDITIEDLRARLLIEGVALVLNQPTDGHIGQLTYIDHQNKCVFDEHELGTPYSFRNMLSRCRQSELVERDRYPGMHQTHQTPQKRNVKKHLPIGVSSSTDGAQCHFDLLATFFTSESPLEQMPWELKRKRRRKNAVKSIIKGRKKC